MYSSHSGIALPLSPVSTRPQSFRATLDKFRETSLFTHLEEGEDLAFEYKVVPHHGMSRSAEELSPRYGRDGRRGERIMGDAWWKPTWRKNPDSRQWMERKRPSFETDLEVAGAATEDAMGSGFERKIFVGSCTAMLLLLFLSVWFIARETS